MLNLQLMTIQTVYLISALLISPMALAITTESKVAEVETFQFGKPSKKIVFEKKPSPRIQTLQSLNSQYKRRETIRDVINTDFWIYDAWLTLETDKDYDGYYSEFTLEFDADTIYTSAPVYAVLYLGDEDTFYPIHTTDAFWIYGEDTLDSYLVETSLVTGFPPFDYDIMIELYTADTDELVAVADHLRHADLSYVPLESRSFDRRVATETGVEVHKHGGGTFYWPVLALLGAFAIWRKVKNETR